MVTPKVVFKNVHLCSSFRHIQAKKINLLKLCYCSNNLELWFEYPRSNEYSVFGWLEIICLEFVQLASFEYLRNRVWSSNVNVLLKLIFYCLKSQNYYLFNFITFRNMYIFIQFAANLFKYQQSMYNINASLNTHS